MRFGDAIATAATPIARAFRMPCIDPETNQLRPESDCAKRRNVLNDFSDAIFDRFWPSSNNGKGENKMQFIVTKQISVEAETPEEAVAKSAEGTTISISANARPQPQMSGRPVPTPTVRPQ